MDWNFLSIFKKAEFNTLMFSLAVMGWILIIIYPYIIFFQIIAILCSVYCISRLVVHLYHVYQINQAKKADAKYEKDQKEKLTHDKELQAQFVYDRLSLDNQKILQEIIRRGEKSCYSDVYIIKDKLSNCMFISQVRMILFSDNMINNWISIEESSDSYSIYIKSPLNSIIESRINK